MLAESRDKEILSLDGTGQVREYTLYYVFVFKVDDGQWPRLHPADADHAAPGHLGRQQHVLAKQAEEDLLYRDMQSDLVQQLLRRLAAVKPG